MKTTVLLTGGTGYVGGRIARRLMCRDDVKLLIGARQKGGLMSSWLDNDMVVPLEITSNKSLETACSGVDCVVHLAALNEIDSAADPEQALLINGLGTLKLLQASEKAGVRRFIYFSTAHVYGSPLSGVITEKTLARPVHPYAITHRIAEDFVLASHDRKLLTGIVIRLSNSFGAPADRQVKRWTLLINDLCRQVVETGCLTLSSSGMQRRDFIPLEDVAGAVEHLLFLHRDLCGDGLFNLGGASSLRVIDVAERVAGRCQDVLGFLPEIRRPQPGGSDVCAALEFNIDKLMATGFSLSGNMDQEIDSTLLFCQQVFGGKQ